jgi:hypothetical protein
MSDSTVERIISFPGPYDPESGIESSWTLEHWLQTLSSAGVSSRLFVVECLGVVLSSLSLIRFIGASFMTPVNESREPVLSVDFEYLWFIFVGSGVSRSYHKAS